MGGLRNIPVDDAISDVEKKQQQQREAEAYKKGKERHEKNQDDPNNQGGPKEDGYGSMTPGEKEAYKKRHRGG
jgi:hypothetical protein